MQSDSTVTSSAVSQMGRSPRPTLTHAELRTLDERASFQRLLADGRKLRELSHLLCAIAREQLAFCAEQRALPPRQRVEAIRERRGRLYTTAGSTPSV